MAAEELPSDLVEPKVLARRLSVHLSTIHRWIRAGKLRAWRRAGERYLVSLAEGLALVAPVTVVQSDAPRSKAQEELAASQATARLRAKGYRC